MTNATFGINVRPRWGRIRNDRIRRVPPYAIFSVSVGDKIRTKTY